MDDKNTVYEECYTRGMVLQKTNAWFMKSTDHRQKLFRRMATENHNLDLTQKRMLRDCWRKMNKAYKKLLKKPTDFEIPKHQMHKFMEPWINYDAALNVIYLRFFGKQIDSKEEDADDTIHGPDWS